MDTLHALTAFYSTYDEDNRLRSRHGSIEYLTTMRYIEKYLCPGMRVADIGAGTGRYSLALAAKGYAVDAVELIDHNIEIFRSHIPGGAPVTIRQGNATDLYFLPDSRYDITLLLGPMYHLFTAAEQHRALTEALRITKPGGLLFAAYCNNDATVVQFCFQKGMLLQEPYRTLIDPITFKAASTPEELFQLYRKEDIDTLMAPFAATRLHYVGTDMATLFMRDTVDNMSDELFEKYLQYHFYICERPDMTGATHHILDISRKEK